MRSVRAFALLGSFLLATAASAQSLVEHAAAASGATIGTAAGKPLSNALTNIFGQVDHTTATAAASKEKTKTPAKVPADQKAGALAANGTDVPGAAAGSTEDRSAPALPRARTARSASRLRTVAVAPAARAYVAPDIVEPPRKEPSAEELAAIKVGMTGRELQAALGVPASHVTIPDDDGHLRESCQYWAQGKPLGTVRLDNGQVVRVELIGQN